MNKYDKINPGIIIATIISFIIFVFLESAFWLGIGYFSGWVTKITVGTQCVTALNTAFGTEFTADMLPWIGAALAWVGSFFKTSNTSIKKSK